MTFADNRGHWSNYSVLTGKNFNSTGNSDQSLLTVIKLGDPHPNIQERLIKKWIKRIEDITHVYRFYPLTSR